MDDCNSLSAEHMHYPLPTHFAASELIRTEIRYGPDLDDKMKMCCLLFAPRGPSDHVQPDQLSRLPSSWCLYRVGFLDPTHRPSDAAAELDESVPPIWRAVGCFEL